MLIPGSGPRTPPSVETRRRWVGVAVLVAALLAAWLGVTKPDPFAHDETVEVIFDHVQSLAHVQRDVRAAGVNVGSIGQVRRVGEHAEVQLILHQHITIYRDATADLRPHTPFEGTAFIDLDPGHPGAGKLGSRPIPLSQTHVFVSAGEVLSTFTPPVRESFRQIVAELARALERPGQIGLSTALHNAPALAAQTALVARALRGPHGSELRSLIPAAAATVDALAGEDGQLRSAVHDARSTFAAVTADNGSALDRSLAALPGALDAAASGGRQASALLRQAGRAAAALGPALEAIPAPTTGLTALLRRATPSLQALPPVTDALTTTLTRLGRAAPALAPLFATMRPVGALSVSRLLPYLDSRSAYGLPIYLQLIAANTGFTGSLAPFLSPGAIGGVSGHGFYGTLTLPGTPAPPGLGGVVSCAAIARINPSAVAITRGLGLCYG